MKGKSLSFRTLCTENMPLFVLPQVQKRNFIENIIPIIISLKTVLEKNKIPALRELMNYLRVKDDLVCLYFVVGVALPAAGSLFRILVVMILVVSQWMTRIQNASKPWLHFFRTRPARQAFDCGEDREFDHKFYRTWPLHFSCNWVYEELTHYAEHVCLWCQLDSILKTLNWGQEQRHHLSSLWWGIKWKLVILFNLGIFTFNTVSDLQVKT